MIVQMQFLSVLLLVETKMSTPFRNFLDQLKWLNLYFSSDVQVLGHENKERFGVLEGLDVLFAAVRESPQMLYHSVCYSSA